MLSRLGEVCALRDAWHPAWAGRPAGLQARLTGRRLGLCVWGQPGSLRRLPGRPLTAARVAEGGAELDRLLSLYVSLIAFFQNCIVTSRVGAGGEDTGGREKHQAPAVV